MGCSEKELLTTKLVCPDLKLRDGSVNPTAALPTITEPFLEKILTLQMAYQVLSCHSICFDITKSFRKHYVMLNIMDNTEEIENI